MPDDVESARPSIGTDSGNATASNNDRPDHHGMGARLTQAMRAIQAIGNDERNEGSSTIPAITPAYDARPSYELIEGSANTDPGRKPESDHLRGLGSIPGQRPTRVGTLPVTLHSPVNRSLDRESLRTEATRLSGEIRQEALVIDQFLKGHFRDDIFDIRKQKDQFPRFPSLAPKLGLASKPKPESTPQVTIELSIAALNRMRMRKLQIQLSNRIMDMHYLQKVPDDWERLLADYITATRDNDYIRTCVERGLHDPFLIKSERMVDAAILSYGLNNIPQDKWEEDLMRVGGVDGRRFNLVPPVEKESTAIGGTRSKMNKIQQTEAFLQRTVVCFIGGAFLVGPMWLMVMADNQLASLVSTSVFVFVWGLMAAYALSDPIAVLSTTAAYAAVLVVFVGSRD